MTSSATRPLDGARVLITRSVDRAGDMAAAVVALGGIPVVMPVVALAPPEPQSAAALAAAVADFAGYDWVLVASKNAAERWLAALGAAPREAVRWACVGPVTAAALAEAGVALALPPAKSAAALAAAILDRGPVAGARVLVPRAAGGRDDAVVALRRAGATVDTVVLYRSVTAEATDPAVAAGLSALRAGQVEVACLFAPSQVAALFELLGPGAAEILARCRVVAAIGATTRAALVERGVPVAVVPPAPEVAALANLVGERYQEEPH